MEVPSVPFACSATSSEDRPPFKSESVLTSKDTFFVTQVASVSSFPTEAPPFDLGSLGPCFSFMTDTVSAVLSTMDTSS